MDFGELTEYIVSIGQPAFRAKQLYEWMHIKLASSYEEMSNIPAAMKVKCGESFSRGKYGLYRA